MSALPPDPSDRAKSPRAATAEAGRATPAIDVVEPDELVSPLVFASPHSGAVYPRDFVAQSSLELATLRKSEDSYVDELFADAVSLGAPMLRALFPRAYLDVNREPYELDPEMFDGPLPSFVNSSSARVAAGLGTVARIVATRREIYRGKLSFFEVEQRLATFYRPYHHALRGLVARAHERFGFCVLVDCHSMPSSGLPVDADGSPAGIDFVLGDRNGLSCHPLVTEAIEQTLDAMGYRVMRNNPYSGGFTTQHYGDPANGFHTIQVEINRALYMDEASLQRRAGFPRLRADLAALIRDLTSVALEAARPLRYLRLSAE
ncbi:MAG: N-formylglutamate amidohydrolase [Rhodospirillaceae bacterium]|nr:N-formylglutamate amidohydrolase [Rhodospirillaceae bacterium]